MDAVLSVTPYYNKPNRRGIVAPLRARSRAAAGDTPVILYNIPGRTAVNMPPDLLAELAQIDGIEAVKQANSRRAAADRRPRASSPATTTSTRAAWTSAAPAASASPRTSSGNEMRRMYDEPDARAEIDAVAAGGLRRDVHHRQPDAGQGRAEPCSATTPAALRLPLVECDEAERAHGARRARAPRPARRGHRRVSGTLRVLPLGGVGEIGKNMTVVEYDGRIVVVDCGLRFPTAEMMGIDLVLPDFTYLRERVDDIEAIVITHGHEDHLGALPWVLRDLGQENDPGRLRRPADGRDGALQARRAQAARRQRSRCCRSATSSRPARSRSSASTSRTRSRTPSGVALTTRARHVLFTGDYKFDQTPVGGAPADMARLAELGREGLLLLCGDSTNADRAGHLGPASRSSARTSSACSPAARAASSSPASRRTSTASSRSSHAAAAHGRKVALVGRSMRKNVNIGRSLGHIDIPEGMLVPPREIDQWADEKIVVISTGSQGEPLSRAAPDGLPRPPAGRAASAATRSSSRATPIPGNERAVNETIDRLYHIGCDVVTARDAPIHASGHGYAEEVKMMLNLTRPRYVMPVHGDFKRMLLHCAARRGRRRAGGEHLPHRERHAAGDRRLRRPLRRARSRPGMIFVDGVDIGDVADVALRDRRMLSRGRHLHHRRDRLRAGRLVRRPARGARPRRAVPGRQRRVHRRAARGGRGLAGPRRRAADHRDRRAASRFLHDDLATFIYDRLKRRPMVLPVVVEV